LQHWRSLTCYILSVNERKIAMTRNSGSAPAPESGFTLIELVIVITIIGILAAVALPRLIDAQRDARIAKANAIYGSIRSAVALARSRCELDLAGTAASVTAINCASSPPKVNMDGIMVDIVNRLSGGYGGRHRCGGGTESGG
jgi:prepilin-type N-terminal cleavage/methylation domain-containing protein